MYSAAQPLTTDLSNCKRMMPVLARDRHTALIREFLGVTAYGPSCQAGSRRDLPAGRADRDDLPDIINMAIEELIRQRFELPAFTTLLRIARTTRNTVNRRYQSRSVNCWTPAPGIVCWRSSADRWRIA